MSNLTTYSLPGVSANLDGLKVVGFFEGDDVVSVESREDGGDWMIGADGSGVFSRFADNSVKITLKLNHNSPTHQQLLQKFEQQKADVLEPFPFDVVDTNGGEGGNAANCMIMTPPTMAYGKNASVREWVLVSATWQQNVG